MFTTGDKGYRPTGEPPRHGIEKAAEIRRLKVDNAAHRVEPMIRECQAADMSLNGIAAHLNAVGIRTARGGNWTMTAVKRALARI